MKKSGDHIQVSPELTELLMTYHGGQETGCYSVGSRLFAGHEVPRADEAVDRAIRELEGHMVWVRKHEREESEERIRECERLIAWLSENQDLVAQRLCGSIKIYISCLGPVRGQHRYRYKCSLSVEMRPHEIAFWVCEVTEPVCSDVAVDSDIAYDRVSRAAVAFAQHEPDEEDRDNFPDDTYRQAFCELAEYDDEAEILVRRVGGSDVEDGVASEDS